MMNPIGYVLLIPIVALAWGGGMWHCWFIMNRWPEKNGFRKIK